MFWIIIPIVLDCRVLSLLLSGHVHILNEGYYKNIALSVLDLSFYLYDRLYLVNDWCIEINIDSRCTD